MYRCRKRVRIYRNLLCPFCVARNQWNAVLENPYMRPAVSRSAYKHVFYQMFARFSSGR